MKKFISTDHYIHISALRESDFIHKYEKRQPAKEALFIPIMLLPLSGV
ncbi:MAG: hypothetical protein HFI89_10620 [Lachnospiraceae bacterium]|nr:hypothetical protein [Lachnospiraceae bacterium]